MSTQNALHLIAFSTPLGWLAAVGSDDQLVQLTFGHASLPEALQALPEALRSTLHNHGREPRWAQALRAYCAGRRGDLSTIAVDLQHLTPFQRRVVNCCRRIPAGQTVSYAELARRAGSPRAARAVGTVMARNRIPLVIPCHRVVGSNGGLGGYSAPGGLATKQRLLAWEAGQKVHRAKA